MHMRARALAFGGVGACAEAVLVMCVASRERACGSSAGGGAAALRGRTPLTSFNVVSFFFRRAIIYYMNKNHVNVVPGVKLRKSVINKRPRTDASDSRGQRAMRDPTVRTRTEHLRVSTVHTSTTLVQ